MKTPQCAIEIIIPLPPSQNHAYVTTRQGKRIMTAVHRDFKEAMRLQLKTTIKKCYKTLDLLKLRFFWPDKRRRDYDNYEKITLDILKGILVEDDSCWHIKEKCSITGGIDKENPRVEITWLGGNV